jgi:thiosulfate dehydrogenase (quinone) large subunit
LTTIDLRAWAVLCARVVLGLIFGMAGWWKCFVLTPAGHYHRFFEPFASTWIPVWLLWAIGVTIPIVELVFGWLLVVGLLIQPSLVALGIVLMTVTYGHLLQEPLYSFTGHVFPRLSLLVFVAVMADWDRYSLDRAWFATRAAAAATAAGSPR